ncbi:MAG: shikimate dehydrogenase, partial [Firmicutes bacterium]|nr:shikimate dehydrogenase [Bacillota bacterium]
IDRLADKHGFKLAGLRSFERALGEEEILAIKQRVKGTRAMAAGLS